MTLSTSSSGEHLEPPYQEHSLGKTLLSLRSSLYIFKVLSRDSPSSSSSHHSPPLHTPREQSDKDAEEAIEGSGLVPLSLSLIESYVDYSGRDNVLEEEGSTLMDISHDSSGRENTRELFESVTPFHLPYIAYTILSLSEPEKTPTKD